MDAKVAPRRLRSRIAREHPGQIEPGRPLEPVIGPGFPVFDFPEGKSYFAAYTRPVAPRPRVLELMTGADGIILGASTVFIPEVMFLGETHQPIEDEDWRTWQQAAKLFEPGFSTTSFWSSTYRIPKGARHLVIFTSARRIGQTIVHHTVDPGGAFMLGRSVVIMPGGATIVHHVPRSATGSVKLRAR